MEPNLDALAAHFRVFTPERRSHGRTPDVEGRIAYELMAQTRSRSSSRSWADRRVVGCSAGASVARLVALRRPDLIRRLVLIAGVFDRHG